MTDVGSWKYRRYECAGQHKFSTNESVYEPVRGHKKNLVQFQEELGGGD